MPTDSTETLHQRHQREADIDAKIIEESVSGLHEQLAILNAFNAASDDWIFPARIVCKVLDIAPGTLANLNNAGAGPVFYKRGHSRYYRKADVLEWMMKERRVA